MRKIQLSQNFIVLVDDSDYDRVIKFKWYAKYDKRAKRWYVRRNKTKHQTYQMLHRFILDAPSNMQVDHINNNPLDNRKENLRLATNTQNSRNSVKPSNNSSGYKGVYWNKAAKKWHAQIRIDNGKRLYLGLFSDVKDAYTAYCEAAEKYHGEFKRLD